jgi:hypothetical protein
VIRLTFIAAMLMADVAWAGLDLSLRPVGRAGTGVRNVEALAERPLEAQLHLVAVASIGTSSSLRPTLRPNGIVTQAMARKNKRLKGAVCGDPDIQGEVVGRVPGKLNGCGVENAVRVRSVAGITLSQQSVMDCGTANALKNGSTKGPNLLLAARAAGCLVSKLRHTILAAPATIKRVLRFQNMEKAALLISPVWF